jgi:hypothetical protein
VTLLKGFRSLLNSVRAHSGATVNRISSPVRWGTLRRVAPISRRFGYDRGTPIDRFYIERFLARHAFDIRGRVLEIGDDAYTKHFGSDRVTRSDVLHAQAGTDVTLVGDLATGAGIPDHVFDCIILTQTLPFIFDVRGAVASCMRSLSPGGVVLATLPGISQVSRYDMDRWGDFWRFTDLSARKIFSEQFGENAVRVECHGNVLAATGLLHGIAAEELSGDELAANDRDYQVLITVRAQRCL